MPQLVAVPVAPTGEELRIVEAPVEVMACPENGVSSTNRTRPPLCCAWIGEPLSWEFSAVTSPVRSVVAVFSVTG
ncbi:hypothetical protein D3C76_1571450 [compost metagenome]